MYVLQQLQCLYLVPINIGTMVILRPTWRDFWIWCLMKWWWHLRNFFPMNFCWIQKRYMLHMYSTYVRTYSRWCVCVLMYRWGSLKIFCLQYNMKQPLVYPFLLLVFVKLSVYHSANFHMSVCRVEGHYTCRKERHTYLVIPANQKNG